MNQEKIKEIAQKVEAKYQMGGLSDGLYYDFAKDVAKEYGQYIRQQTLEEAIGSVPEERLESWIVSACPVIDEKAISFNSCRQQTLSNLQALKDKN